MPAKKIDSKEYLQYWSMLAEMESKNYTNYENTIITLSAAFLAFSVSFLALFKSAPESGAVFSNLPTLELSWVAFAISVISMLVCFLASGLAHRFVMYDWRDARQSATASNRRNPWKATVIVLYVVSGIGFIAGVILLLSFCARNIGVLRLP